VVGTEGRIDIDAVWYNQTSFTLCDRGMQFQALETERYIQDGLTESPAMPVTESVSIMETMDEVRRQIRLTYPGLSE
jgi:hypothetical protein